MYIFRLFAAQPLFYPKRVLHDGCETWRGVIQGAYIWLAAQEQAKWDPNKMNFPHLRQNLQLSKRCQVAIVKPKRPPHINWLNRPVLDCLKQSICSLPAALEGFGHGHEHLHAVLGIAPCFLQVRPQLPVKICLYECRSSLVSDRVCCSLELPTYSRPCCRL